jgi:hypothetical protein
MRLYRGLKEPYRPEAVGGDRLSGTDFTDCPHTALQFAHGPRGVLLVADVPDDGSCRVSEELWANKTAKRMMIWGRFDHHIVAAIPAKELRSLVRKKGVAGQSFEFKAAVLRDHIDRKLSPRLTIPQHSPDYVSPYTTDEHGWEKRGSHGEVWIDRANAAPKEIADHLAWVIREYSSRARRVHQSCGTLPFTLGARRTPPTIAWSFTLSFDLALMDRDLIEERVRQRGGDLGSGSCPMYWLERAGMILAADAREVVTPGNWGAARESWISAIDAVAGIEVDKLTHALVDGEHGYLAAILVAVHEEPVTSSGPSRDECLRHHRALLAELGLVGGREWPVSWNSLWRLPPGLKVAAPGRAPWLRFPAVSFVAAVSPLRQRVR